MAWDSERVFENPPNKGYIKEGLMIAGFTFGIGVVILAWTGNWAAMAMAFVIGGIELLVSYWREYIRRPTIVRIVGGGLELDF